jgi:transglutaminase-like putative cysteine protease
MIEPIRYRILHRTRYEYSSPALLCHNTMHLSPRDLPYQKVDRSNIQITPIPSIRRPRQDPHGNRTEFFSIESQHQTMLVEAESIVIRSTPDWSHTKDITYLSIRNRLHSPLGEEDRIAQEFCFDSTYIRTESAFSEYAWKSFHSHSSLLESVTDLTRRIFREFRYVPNSTLVSTTPREVLRSKQGVCQDFAHLQIACLRSIGLAARYVSGYLLTHPAPGQPKLVGADASHAWISVYFGELGWIDFDPTNNAVPKNEHITVAWGADYADVAPIVGLLIGGGLTRLEVSVDVAPLEN